MPGSARRSFLTATILIVGVGVTLVAQVGCRPSAPTVSTGSDSSGSNEERLKQAAIAPSGAKAPLEVQLVALFQDGAGDNHPFAQRVPMGDFPRDMTWLNTSGPVRMRDLRGKFVLLDFWTYCCINCIHILPELKKLEKKYPNELVVIGVHSAKFETEKDTKNIEEAIMRYEIEHPVVNDAEHAIWDSVGVQSWPTMLLVDPEGKAVWMRAGEVTFEQLDEVIKEALPYYKRKKLLDTRPVHFDLAAYRAPATPLRYPGKVLADEAGGRLFIADSNHNRIVVAGHDGKLIDVIGSGAIGRANGAYDKCSFNKPQGMTLDGDTLYVADTENHMLRAVDLQKRLVSKIAGEGTQGRGWPGIEKVRRAEDLPDNWNRPPLETALNSPWDLWVHGKHLYIAMAGPHQIWRMNLDRSLIGPYAGNGAEDILDGPLLPREPYADGFSAFAQPSGLSSDGEWLYVADSEGSSIRAVPFDDSMHVKTIVGTSELPYNRLFTFGDVDGPLDKTRLQHPLGVVYHEEVLYVADTYNNKIKAIDLKSGSSKSLAGTGKPGAADEPAQFDEPAGMTLAAGKLYIADTNNHLIRTVDLETGKTATLTIAGLTPPKPAEASAKKPDFSSAAKVNVKAAKVRTEGGELKLEVQLAFPKGWKINPLAPMSYYVEADGKDGPVARSSLGKLVKLPEPAEKFEVTLPSAENGDDKLAFSVNYYYCQEGGEGLCKVGQVAFTVPLKIAANNPAGAVKLRHEVTP